MWACRLCGAPAPQNLPPDKTVGGDGRKNLLGYEMTMCDVLEGDGLKARGTGGKRVSCGLAGCCTPSPPRRSESVSCWNPTASVWSGPNASGKSGGGGGRSEAEEGGGEWGKKSVKSKETGGGGWGGNMIHEWSISSLELKWLVRQTKKNKSKLESLWCESIWMEKIKNWKAQWFQGGLSGSTSYMCANTLFTWSY